MGTIAPILVTFLHCRALGRFLQHGDKHRQLPESEFQSPGFRVLISDHFPGSGRNGSGRTFSEELQEKNAGRRTALNNTFQIPKKRILCNPEAKGVKVNQLVGSHEFCSKPDQCQQPIGSMRSRALWGPGFLASSSPQPRQG